MKIKSLGLNVYWHLLGYLYSINLDFFTAFKFVAVRPFLSRAPLCSIYTIKKTLNSNYFNMKLFF